MSVIAMHIFRHSPLFKYRFHTFCYIRTTFTLKRNVQVYFENISIIVSKNLYTFFILAYLEASTRSIFQVSSKLRISYFLRKKNRLAGLCNSETTASILQNDDFYLKNFIYILNARVLCYAYYNLCILEFTFFNSSVSFSSNE